MPQVTGIGTTWNLPNYAGELFTADPTQTVPLPFPALGSPPLLFGFRFLNGFQNIAVDMAIGEFLTAKKTFSPDSIAGLDLDIAVKQIQTGDTNTVFATGEGSLTAEQRLNAFLNYLLTYGRDEFSCYRKIRW